MDWRVLVCWTRSLTHADSVYILLKRARTVFSFSLSFFCTRTEWNPTRKHMNGIKRKKTCGLMRMNVIIASALLLSFFEGITAGSKYCFACSIILFSQQYFFVSVSLLWHCNWYVAAFVVTRIARNVRTTQHLSRNMATRRNNDYAM